MIQSSALELHPVQLASSNFFITTKKYLFYIQPKDTSYCKNRLFKFAPSFPPCPLAWGKNIERWIHLAVKTLSYKQPNVADSYHPLLICNARNKPAQEKYWCPSLWLHLAANLWKPAVKPLPEQSYMEGESQSWSILSKGPCQSR